MLEDKSMLEQLDKKEKEIDNLKLALDEENKKVISMQQLCDQVEQKNKKILEGLENEKQASLNTESLLKQLKHMEESQKILELQLTTEREASKSINSIKERKDKLENQVDSLMKENNDLKNKLQNQTVLSNSIPIEATNNNSEYLYCYMLNAEPRALFGRL